MKQKEYVTLTGASLGSGLLTSEPGLNSTYLSSSRSIPYAEIYSFRTGMMETPAEHIQRAADDEAKRRRAKSDDHQ